METRSGKKYELKIINKKQYKCSFCHEIGHKINKCKSENIEILYKKLIEALVFSTNIFNSNVFVYIWLHTLQIYDKKVLTHKIFNSNKNINHKYAILINKLLENESNNLDFIEIFNEIDDETLKLYIILIKLEFVGESMINFYINKINLLKSNFRKFDIKINLLNLNNYNECPICMEDDISSSKLIKTNCNHIYCDKCFKKYLYTLNSESNINPSCACCRTPIKELYFESEEIFNLYKKKYILNI